MKKESKGITLVTLVITIIILLILAGVAITALTQNGLLENAEKAKSETTRSQATETINLKITDIQIDSYAENKQLPNLQYLADKLCEDDDMEYVLKTSKKSASLEKINVSGVSSIYTKLKKYPYEFEINSSLQLASIDGIKLSSASDNWNDKNTWNKLLDIGFSIDEIVNNKIIFEKVLNKKEDIDYIINSTSDIMPFVVNSKVAMKTIAETTDISKYIFGSTEEKIETNTIWLSAILNNSNALAGLDESNPINVPVMTGYNTPSGEVSSSSEESSSYASWKAFNRTLSSNTDAWLSKGLPAWIQYKFDNPVLVYKFEVYNRFYSYSNYVNAICDFSLNGSLDGENWDLLGNYTNDKYDSMQGKTYVVNDISKRYRYYRITVNSAKLTDGTLINANAAIGKIQFYAK